MIYFNIYNAFVKILSSFLSNKNTPDPGYIPESGVLFVQKAILIVDELIFLVIPAIQLTDLLADFL